MRPLQCHAINAFRRSLHSQWIPFMVGPGTFYVFAINVKLKLMTATRTDMLGFAWACVFCLTVGLANIVWTTGLDVAVLRYFRSSRVAPQHEIAIDSTTDRLSLLSFFPTDEAPAGIRKQAPKSPLSGLAISSKASFKQRQLQILISMVLLLLATPFASWVTVAAVWCAKLAALLMVLLTRDPTYTMDQLKLAEPGFGMLVNAGHLRAALQAFLAGSTYTGPLEKTRGSYYCMDDALSVSYRCGFLLAGLVAPVHDAYRNSAIRLCVSAPCLMVLAPANEVRTWVVCNGGCCMALSRWQDQEVEICPGLSLNMSRWQLSELEKAIGRSRCIYVWIDKLALPQDESRLQRTLLSR